MACYGAQWFISPMVKRVEKSKEWKGDCGEMAVVKILYNGETGNGACNDDGNCIDDGHYGSCWNDYNDDDNNKRSRDGVSYNFSACFVVLFCHPQISLENLCGSRQFYNEKKCLFCLRLCQTCVSNWLGFFLNTLEKWEWQLSDGI